MPVPAQGTDAPAPGVCATSLEVLRRRHAWMRWLPDVLACRWLTEDASAVVPEGGIPTPSWCAAGAFADRAGSADEAALFHTHGWRIAWTHAGLQLSPLDAPPPTTDEPRTIRRIEDMGMSSFRDERW